MESKIIGERIENLIKESKMTKKEVAQKIGIKNKNLENKLKGREEFCIDEIITIKKIFHLTTEECAKIFFCEEEANSNITM